MPTSMATALLSTLTDTFYGINYISFRHLNSTLGSSRIACSAYQNMAHWTLIIHKLALNPTCLGI